jgi:hypothetical protein
VRPTGDESVATVVEAHDGDTLCTIAIAHGFANCDRLRAEDANRDFRSRPLRDGDRVTVPDLEEDQEGGGNEERHPFRRRGVPPPSIRFVHGSRNGRYRDDPPLDHLNVSNYVCNKAGSDGSEAFSTAFGFDEHADVDEDTFKIEVVDPNAAGNTVTVKLEALKPVTQRDGSIEYESVGNPNAGMRAIEVACDPVASSNRVRLRSRYLRLVTDEWDSKAISGDPTRTDGTAQGLLVSDTADGNDGDPDALEILDQHVRASHTVVGCSAADPHKCKVTARVPIGPRRRKVRTAFHIFRTTPGGASIASVGEQEVRQRVRHWFRRIFAQAELSPIIVDSPGIEILDPPPANMVVIAQNEGTRSSGVNSGGAPSKVTLRSTVGSANTDWDVALAANLTPKQVADRIAANLPAGHSATTHENAACIGKPRGSADVLITRDDGQRNTISVATTDDTRLIGKISVADPDVNLLGNPAGFSQAPEAEAGARHLLRVCQTSPDRLDFVVVKRFVNMGTGAYAMMQHRAWPAANRPRQPVSLSVFVGALSNGARMDTTDSFYSVLAHEAGHAMSDVYHPKNSDPLWRTCWMHNFESSGDQPDIGKRKRIEDDPLSVEFEVPKSSSPWWEHDHINPVDRLRTNGAPCLEAW